MPRPLRDRYGAGGGDDDESTSQQQKQGRKQPQPPMRSSAGRTQFIARSAAVTATLALLALAATAAAAAAPPAPTAAVDAAPAPGAMMAVPPPPPPPLLAPSEAAERFARSVVLESVGNNNENSGGEDEGGAAGPPAAGDLSAAAAAAAAGPNAGGGDGELLRWAIAHSDPAALREAAKSAKDLTVEERRRRVAELRAVMEGGGVASDADLIKRAVAELDAFLSAGAKPASDAPSAESALSALERLADLAQSIDNANDLRPLKALTPLAALIGAAGGGDSSSSAAATDPALRAAAARCIGVAASNNARFQGDLMAAHPQAVARLVDALGGAADAEEEKLRLPLLFAASTFARSAAAASREAFFAAGGVPRLVELLGDGSERAPALALNAAVLLGDLADLGAAGDDGGALTAAVGRADGGGNGGSTWRALAEGVLRTVDGAESPAAMDKALSAVRALSGLKPARAALAAAGGEKRLAAVAARGIEAKAGGGGAEYRQYLADLAKEVAGMLGAGGGGDQKSEL